MATLEWRRSGVRAIARRSVMTEQQNGVMMGSRYDVDGRGATMSLITGPGSLYERDFVRWSAEQAAGLRRLAEGYNGDLDLLNIALEIESLGRSEKRELINRLAVLLSHLLKWKVQPGLRSASWRLTVKEQRLRLGKLLADNPSLRPGLLDAVGDAYQLALIAAQRETGLGAETFPDACSWRADDLLADEWWPG
jgi:hypothetical protein